MGLGMGGDSQDPVGMKDGEEDKRVPGDSGVPVPRVLSGHGDPHDAIVTVVPLGVGWIPQAPASLGGSSGNWCHCVSEGGTCTPGVASAPQGVTQHPEVAPSTPRHLEAQSFPRAEEGADPSPWGQRCWGAHWGP